MMLAIDKKKDIAILSAVGADEALIKKIFLSVRVYDVQVVYNVEKLCVCVCVCVRGIPPGITKDHIPNIFLMIYISI